MVPHREVIAQISSRTGDEPLQHNLFRHTMVLFFLEHLSNIVRQCGGHAHRDPVVFFAQCLLIPPNVIAHIARRNAIGNKIFFAK